MREGMGRQLLCDCWGCNENVFSASAVRSALQEAGRQANVTVLQLVVHEFEPQGVSAVALISESHISIHTWPEEGYLALDAFTCGDNAIPERCVDVLREIFDPERIETRELVRGGSALGEGDRWFIEEQTPNVHFRVRVRERLCTRRTPFQQLELVDTHELGRLLALDGKVMLTERDERFYHEMLVHPALLTHPNPQRVLVVGGGDGGAVRETLQHPSVREVLWVEIDSEVLETARQFLPTLCDGVFDNPKVTLHVGAGEQFITALQDEVDVIIVDGTDPIGPALPLFEKPFFQHCKEALSQGGILAMQCGTPFYFAEEVKNTHANLRATFAQVRLYLGFVPSYPSGLWAYVMASDAPLNIEVPELARRVAERNLKFTYYTPELHQASAVLPRFVQELLGLRTLPAL